MNSNNFGLLIAYLIPGFVVLYGVASVSTTASEWLTATPEASPTISGFLFGTIAAIALGLVVNAIRWHIVDPLHYASGVPRKDWDYSLVPDQVTAFQFLVANQFRYYECYANTLVATAFTFVTNAAISPVNSAEIAGFLLIQLTLWSASRRTLTHYHLRISAFLRHHQPVDSTPTVGRTVDPVKPRCYTALRTARRPRILFPFILRRTETARNGIYRHNL